MINPPTGKVTFLFTDIEGSTKLAQQFPEALPLALEIHHKILRSAIESNNGFVFEIIGDAFCAAFHNSADAVKASYDAQFKLNSEKWSDVVIKVRMGIHSGNVEWNGKRYMGYITLAGTQRVMSAAYGGQVLISEDAYYLLTEKEITGISYRDLGERRLKDLIKPVKIYQLISNGILSDFPPLKTLDARPNNLPVQLTSFIGREDEIKKIKEILKNTHLLTLTGPGGAGKTRLSLQAGADVIDDFANGVWFVELAPIFNPLLLPLEILKELGIKEKPTKKTEETLEEYLKNREILIILDNCEHLIETCAMLTEKLLKVCPKLKIIATSRESLKCSGEQTLSVLSLKTPGINEKLQVEQLIQYASVKLFIERALTVNQNFRVTNENAPALAGICTQLDGIPLAIELAAARVKVLTVEKIYERLNNRFSLLTGGKRTALPRQQTLKALIDWSYDLLPDKEKILWGRLSVFNNGWTLEAAENICSGESISNAEIFDLLCLLAEKSILIFDDDDDRYRILESLRQYGAEKLKEANEINKILSKHLHYFMELAETAEPELKGSKAKQWLEKLEFEHGNFQSAIEWSLRDGDIEEGTLLAGALGGFWLMRGHFTTGKQLIKKVINNNKGVGKSALAKALKTCGILAEAQGNYDEAIKFNNESLALFTETGSKKGIAECKKNLGNVFFRLRDHKTAIILFEECLALFNDLKEKPSTADVFNSLGSIAENEGDHEKALLLFEKSLALQRESENSQGIAVVLNNLGLFLYTQGSYEKAAKLFEESLDLNRELCNKQNIAYDLFNLGLIAFYQKKNEKAKRLLSESLLIRNGLGDKRGIADSLTSLGYISYNEQEYKQAIEHFEKSLMLRNELEDSQGIAVLLNLIGLLKYSQGDYYKAHELYRKSLKIFCEIEDKQRIAYSLMCIAEICCVHNNLYTSAILTGACHTIYSSLNMETDSSDPVHFKLITDKLKGKLGNEEFQKYLDKGKKLTLEQAVELALKTESEV